MARTAPVIKEQESPADRLLRVVHRETGEKRLLSAAQVMELRLADRQRRDLAGPESQELKWKDQHYFVCDCCGEDTQFYHHQTSITGQQTHWSMAPGSKHTNPECSDFQENLDLLVSNGLAAKGNGDFVVNFPASPRIKKSFNGATDAENQNAKNSGVTVSSKNPSRLKVQTVRDMEQILNEIIDVLGSDLSHSVYDRVYVSFGRQKILVRDAFPALGEMPKMIRHLAEMTMEEREKGIVFFPVVNVLGFSNNQTSASNVVIECEEIAIEYRGRKFRLQIDLVSNDPDVIGGMHKGYFTGPQRVALRIGRGSDPVRDMDHIIDQLKNSDDNRVRVTLRVQGSQDLVVPNENRNNQSAMVIGIDGQFNLDL